MDGSVVRFKHLAVERDPSVKIVWVDGSDQKIYKTENLDSKIPSNVTVIPGIPHQKNKVLELALRERHFLEYASRYADWADVAVFYSPWGCTLARNSLKKRGVPIVFDYIDLIHKFRTNPLERFASRAAVIHALRSSDFVIATAFKLYEDAKRHNRSVQLIPNGVDFGKIRKAKPTPRAKGKVKTPSVGFVGGFGNWVDFDSVLSAARKLSQVNFYFMGDGVQRKKLEQASRELENVFVSSQFVPQPQAFEWMASVDVCLVPFKKNELTDAVCPIKLFEYWAFKKPVVASRTFEVERIARNSVLYASNAREYENAFLKLSSSPSLRKTLGARGFKISKDYDWAKLSKSFVSVLNKVSRKRRAR